MAKHLGLSRREARLLIGAGKVRVAGRTARILTKPVPPEHEVEIERAAVRVEEKAVRSSAAQKVGAERGLVILHRDKALVAVDKPAGLLSEPDRFGAPSVESVLAERLRGEGERGELWLVHRLDAGTSGVLVLARTAAWARRLGRAFRESEARKTYLALCKGRLTGTQLIDQPIARVRGTRHGVRADGKAAVTEVTVLASGTEASLVEARPRTGRTHQIRVHLAHLGHPLLGDRLYEGPGYVGAEARAAVGRPMLHAFVLELPWRVEGERLRLQAAPAADFVALARSLGLDHSVLHARSESTIARTP